MLLTRWLPVGSPTGAIDSSGAWKRLWNRSVVSHRPIRAGIGWSPVPHEALVVVICGDDCIFAAPAYTLRARRAGPSRGYSRLDVKDIRESLYAVWMSLMREKNSRVALQILFKVSITSNMTDQKDQLTMQSFLKRPNYLWKNLCFFFLCNTKLSTSVVLSWICYRTLILMFSLG